MTRDQARRAADLYRALAELHTEVAGDPTKDPPSNAVPMPKPKQRRMSKVKPPARPLTEAQKRKSADVLRHLGLSDPGGR